MDKTTRIAGFSDAASGSPADRPSRGFARRLIAAFSHDRSGATAIEYSLIAVMVAIAIIVSLQFLGNTTSNSFFFIANEMDDAIQNPN
jgi:pilus assembly protein Flp/PilA